MDFAALVESFGVLGLMAGMVLLLLKEQKETRVAHKEEVQVLAEAINNNTKVLERLEVKLGV